MSSILFLLFFCYNQIMITVKRQIEDLIKTTVTKTWPEVDFRKIDFKAERPKEKRYGDYSSNIAMQLSSFVEKEAMEIGKKIVGKIDWPRAFEKVLVVAPGFINFYLSHQWLKNQIKNVLENKKFGQNDLGKNKRVQVEFVSANPTGPLHVGNGRGGFLGDVLANALAMSGYKVQREYYINDRGKQIDILGESVRYRFFQLSGIKIDYPDYCYQGEYIIDLAKKLSMINNYKLKDVSEIRERIKVRALKMMLLQIQRFFSKTLKVKYDRWFSESSLVKRKIPEKMLDYLRQKELSYKKDGALWFKTSFFGDEKDRVLIKSGGEPTYFLTDIAYHFDKLALRKFDKVIDIWGADHFGHRGRMLSAMRAIGFEGKLDIIIYQLVRLMQNGQEIRMSKRAGTYVTLEELIDEVGLDVARFFFLMYAADTHMDFDLNLAKEKSEKNPVYYVQYAHARICSIIKNANKLLKRKDAQDKGAIEKIEEYDLIKEVLKLPEIIEEVATNYEVQKLPFYAQNLATKFHDFYTQCRVIDQDKLNLKRFKLIKVVKMTLEKVLKIMGVSAPEKM